MADKTPSIVTEEKKKKKRRNKKKEKKPIEEKTEPTGDKARAALKQDLRNRLKTRIKMCSVSRSGGTSQDVQNVLKKFNDGDEEKLELMKDIQEDVKGMKQKDAKKYLKQVISGMNSDQTDTFVNMVQDKLPSQSNNIVNYVKRQKKINENEVKSKPQVNPETVYVPTRMMTEEQKAAERARRKLEKTPETLVVTTVTPTPVSEVAAIPKRKKKSFGKIQIDIPKITELRDHPTIDSETKTGNKNAITMEDKKSTLSKKKKTFTSTPTTGIDSINNIFPEIGTPAKDEMKRLSYPQRMHNIQSFTLDSIEQQRQHYLFEAAALVEVVRVVQVEGLPLTPLLPVPETEEFVEYKNIPEKYQKMLTKQSFDVDAFDVKDHWGYRKIQDNLQANGDNIKYVKFRNAHAGCLKFLPKFEKVIQWLSTLQNKKVPLQWLFEVLNNMGIVRQKTENPRSGTSKTWKETFRVLCEEYRDKNNQKITVPIVPFVKLTLQC